MSVRPFIQRVFTYPSVSSSRRITRLSWPSLPSVFLGRLRVYKGRLVLLLYVLPDIFHHEVLIARDFCIHFRGVSHLGLPQHRFFLHVLALVSLEDYLWYKGRLWLQWLQRRGSKRQRCRRIYLPPALKLVRLVWLSKQCGRESYRLRRRRDRFRLHDCQLLQRDNQFQ
jgi:hypothetical protein